ncbi:hypothetical protein ACFL03_03950 [Thermodesulfobacteriota bacterium]
MIKFYTNRELSQKLEINLAKWKRWSREFLPPDPLGGLQSGYARQFNPNEAFAVYLGGHLVADLKFTIPEAKTILQDLKGWLVARGFQFDTKGNSEPKEGVESLVKRYRIFIIRYQGAPENEKDLCYNIRGLISNRSVEHMGFQVMEERYFETSIGRQTVDIESMSTDSVKVLNINGVLERFIDKLQQGRENYQALSC